MRLFILSFTLLGIGCSESLSEDSRQKRFVHHMKMLPFVDNEVNFVNVGRGKLISSEIDAHNAVKKYVEVGADILEVNEIRDQ